MNKMRALVLWFLMVPPVYAAPIEEHDISFTLPMLTTSAGSPAKKVSLADYQDKVVYLDFWASWCTPCLQSMPFLNALRNREKHRGFEVIAINMDKEPADAKKFLQQHPVDYPVVYDLNGNYARQLHIAILPTALLVAPGGRVVLVHRGFKPADQAFLEAVIDKELAGLD